VGSNTAARLGKSPANGFANGPTLDTGVNGGGSVELGDRLLQLTRPLLEGDDVRQVQQALVRNGFQLTVDGFFGPKTEEAVKAFQQQKQLQPVDGIVGPATLAAWDSHLPKGKLTSIILKTSKKQNARRICTMIGPTLRLFDGFDHTSPQLRTK